MIPTDICIFSVAFPPCSNWMVHSTLLKHHKIHENDIRNFLGRTEATEEIRELLFVYIWLLGQKFMVFFSHSVDTVLYRRLKDLNYHHSWIVKTKTFETCTRFMTQKSKNRAAKRNEWNYKADLSLSCRKKKWTKKLEDSRS